MGAVGVGSRRGGPHRGGATPRALTALAAALASAVLIAGCGGSGSNQSASGPAAMLSTLENWSELETPVDQALGILTQQCMAKHGLHYYPFTQAGQPGAASLFATQLSGSALWLGPQSLAWRIVNGWGLYEETMQQLGQQGGFAGGVPQEIRVMQSMRGTTIRTYMKTLYGGGKTTKIRIPGLPGETIQIGGCNTTAGTQLFGSVAASVAVPQYGPAILSGSIQASATRSPVLRASETRWAACVHAGTGIATRSPWQLFLHFYSVYQTKGPTPEVHRKELAAAVTDLRCQRRSRLPQSVQQAAVAAVQGLPRSVAGELQTLLAALDQARVRARAVFARSQANASASTNGGSTNGAVGTAAPAVGGPGISSGPVVVFGG